MKILELRFKNLNSLYGEWTIDFTCLEYVSDKIFAITGPTGAGKSTILDAACLALYGRTPRLKTITKTSNEIMSRQTGECFAEVTFETQAGQFRCHWSQRRANQKPGGNLQDSKHEISDAATNQVLASKKREVAVRVEQTTGMDFDRFTRSMLLAQGGFAAFLSAAPDDRAPILEQITGTAIYSEISKQVHERKSDEHKKLDLLLAETAGIPLLSQEEEQALLYELAGKKEVEKTMGSRSEALEKSILWLSGIETLKKELKSLEKESRDLSTELTAFETDRKRLQRAQAASDLDSPYATLSSKRDQQRSELKMLAASQARVPDQEKNLVLKETALKKTEETISRVRQEQKTELALIKQVRALDFQVSEKQSAEKGAASDCRKSAAQVLEKKEQQKKAVFDQAAAARSLERVDAYLAANAADEGLLTRLAGIAEQIKQLQASVAKSGVVQGHVSGLKKQLEQETNQHQKQSTACAALGEKYRASQKRVARTKESLATLLGDRLLREYRVEHDSLLREMGYLKEIESLEDKRAKLEDGKSCPLCGSEDHPFARGNVPRTDDIEKRISRLADLISRADQLEKDLKDNESFEKTAGVNLAQAEKQLVSSLHRQEASTADLLRAENDLAAAWDKNTELKRSLILDLAPFGIHNIPETGPEKLLTDLMARQETWQARQQQKREIEKKDTELGAAIKSMDAIVKTLEDALEEKQGIRSVLQKDLERLTRDRNELYGRENPDAQEARLEKKLGQAEIDAKTARRDRDHIKQQLTELFTRITALQESTARRKSEIADLETDFIQNCNQAGFPDEPAFMACRLTLEERTRLHQRAGILDQKTADIATRKKDRENRLALETEKKMTDRPQDLLQQEQVQTRQALKTLGEETGAIKQKLKDNRAAKARLLEKKEWIDCQGIECARWDALHALIGSADGKKYRNFAQGLTFEVMVSHANRQLEKMTDRYLLVRDEKQPLELNIMDNYQAGEIRSTKNLSGGESFIVSLSLALGLSNMASRNVRVDSLFLDEGFGTLDEEALETALEALAGLQQEDKLIGIISHVSALKERISTQINIQPVSGGKSMIRGPGCQAMN